MRYIRPLSDTSFVNDPNLISYWKLDGNADDHKGSYHATGYNLIYNGSYSAFGTSGPGFNGYSSYITAGNVLDMGVGSMTINAWMKSSTPVSGSSILCKSSARSLAGRWGIYFDPATTTIRALMEGTTSNTYEVKTTYDGIFDSAWHMVTVVYNRAGSMTIYIDGINRASTLITGAAGQNLNSPDPLYIGAYGNSSGTAPGYMFNGYIDDVAVFNRVLYQNEIDMLASGNSFEYNRPFSDTRLFTDPSLAGYWSLNGNSNDNKGSLHCTDVSVIYSPGPFGLAAFYDGSTSKTSASSPVMTLVNNFAMGCWVKPNDSSAMSVIIQNGVDYATIANGYGLAITNGAGSNGNKLTGIFSNVAWIDSGYTFPAAGVWYHVFMQRVAGNTKFYVNGVQTANTSAYAPLTPTNNFFIGCAGIDSSIWRRLNGGVADVVAFKKTLTDTEVLEIYERDASLYKFRPLSKTKFVRDENLIAYWPMDGSSGDRVGSYSLTDSNVSYVPGLFGLGARYTGSMTSVSSHSSLTGYLGKDSTFSCWAKITSLPAADTAGQLMSSTSSLYNEFWKSLRVYNSAGTRRFEFTKYDGTYNPTAYTTTVTVSINRWYHLCGVQNGATLQIYVDGALAGSAADSTATIVNYAAFNVGSQTTQSGRGFVGVIEDAAVFNRALSRDEIREIYNNTGRGEVIPSVYMSKGSLHTTSLVNDSSLVSYWKFDGNLLDSKGVNHATAVNISGYDGRYGKFSQGLYSAGGSVNRSATVASSASLISPTTSLTICGWVYVTSLVAQTVPICMRYLPDPTSPYNAYLFDIETNNIQFSVTTSGVSGNAVANVVLQPNSWQFLTGTYDGSNVKLYINGILSATATASGSINYGSSRELRIGDNYYGAGQFYTGYIDDVALFSRALSASEVYSIYNAGESSPLRPFDSVFPLRQDSSVVAYWKFDGNTNDERGSYNGTPTNITYSPGINGRFNQSAVFNGTDSIVTSSLNPSTAMGQKFTISTWAYPTAGNNYRGIAGNHYGDATSSYGIVFGQYQDGTWNFGYGTGGATFYGVSTTLTLNQWYHIAVVFDCGVSLKLYVNGCLTSSVSTPLSINHTTSFWIGKAFPSAERFFKGNIDDFVIFNRVLSATEVHKIYTHGSTRGYWKLNGSSADFSGNNNHGTDTNITYSTSNGRVGVGAGFNGSSSKIDVGNGSSLQITKSPMTVSAWVKTMPVSAYRGIVSKMSTGMSYYGFLLRFYALGNVAEFGVSSTGSDYFNVRGKTAIDDNAWHHVVGTYCPGTFLKIYVDGNLERTNTTSIPNAIYNSPGPVLIGASYTTPSEVTSGSIEEVMIEDRVWSESDVRKYYTASKNRNSYKPGPIADGLILYLDPGNPDSYPGSGTTMYDLSGGGRNATWYNSPVHSGTYGGVIQTNGANSYVLVPSASLNLATTNYTIMAATRYSGATRGRIMAGYSNNWLLGHHSSSVLEYYAEGWINDTTVNDTNWRVYAGTGDISGDKYSLYVNGDPIVLNSTGGSAGPNGLVIAGGQYAGEYSIGETGFVLAYNRVLTQAEIRQNFNYFRNRYNL